MSSRSKKYVVHKTPEHKTASTPIPEQEPVFVVRAQDENAVNVVQDYIYRVEGKVSNHVVADLYEHLADIYRWQEEHKDSVKVPD